MRRTRIEELQDLLCNWKSLLAAARLCTMAFAPRSSKGPRRTLQYTGGLTPAQTPSKAKVSLSFDKSSSSGFGESGTGREDSVHSTCDSWPRSEANASPPSLDMSW